MDRKFNRRIAAWVGALVLGLAIPSAFAGTEEDHEKAIKMWEIGNFTEAMALWHKLAEGGYAPAQVWLADMLDYSEQNELAVTWYQKAADQGDAAGEYGLGVMYANGEGVKQDYEKAMKLFHISAEKDYLKAVQKLAVIYETGAPGVPVDAEKAAFWKAKLEALTPKEETKPEEKKKRRRR